jgi:hypothetical protein
MACSFLSYSSCCPSTQPIVDLVTVQYKMRGFLRTGSTDRDDFWKYCLILSKAS